MALSVERLAPTAARERAAMAAGATLDEVLRRLKHEEVGMIEQFVIVRMIKHISFGIAKQIVADHRDLALDLDDLALLASVPKACKALWWLPSTIDWAIVQRDPHTLIAREDREAFMRALEEPAWRREIAIVRDDEQGVYIRFVRVPPKR